MLGTGRVPDAIRLRVGRGRQAGDVWFWIHRSRERYFDELRHIASTPIADEVLDAQGLERIAQSWAWGDPSVPPPKQEITTIDRALAFAAYCREMTARLNQLNRKLVARR
jgi:hypothetical protein